MDLALPCNAPEIFITWGTSCGGIGATAFTDDKGRPYLGLYRIDWDSTQLTAPFYLERPRFMARLLIGYSKNIAVIAFADIEVTTRGIDARFTVPNNIDIPTSDYLVRARWSDPFAIYVPDAKWKRLNA